MTLDLTGRRMFGFQLERCIGAGGMGSVWLARHPILGDARAPVAVKVLAAELARDAGFVERFLVEARLQCALRHEHILAVENVEQEPLPAILMEYVGGGSLEGLIQREAPLAWDRAVALMGGVLAGIGHAHAQGVVHRDLKPANVLLTEEGVPKVADFGIAKVLDARRTRTGAVFGTPRYMSPEQIEGTGQVDARADLYSAGVIFFELVTGQAPFAGAGDSDYHVMKAQVEAAPPDPCALNPALSPAQGAAVLKALEKAPGARYQSAAEMAAALAAVGGAARSSSPERRAAAPGPAPATRFQLPDFAAAGAGADAEVAAAPRPVRGAVVIGGALAVVAVTFAAWFATRTPEPVALSPVAERSAEGPVAERSAAVSAAGAPAVVPAPDTGRVLDVPPVADAAPVAAAKPVDGGVLSEVHRVDERALEGAVAALKGDSPEPQPAGAGRAGGRSVGGVKAAAPKSAPVPSPRVAAGQTVVLGSLDKATISQVIKRHQTEARYCYQQALLRKPTLAGKITVKFTIAANGSVMTAAVTESTMADAQVESCVVSRVKRWRFPAPKGGGIVVVNYPFLFTPG